MKYADLHVHTFYSDSTFSPEMAIACAKGKGLDAIAICDHDSIGGIAPCQKEGSLVSIEVIPAIEMTAEKIDAEIHLLGYFIDWQAEWFKKLLTEIQKARLDRAYEMLKKLKDAGIEMNPENVFRLAGKGTVGRLHVAQAMILTGKVRTFREVFDKYIGFGKPCYVPYTKFSPKEAIEIILKAGGVPVLAHPNILGKDEYIPEFIGYGLRGIEVYHTDHNSRVRVHYEGIAKRYNLLMTGGSDCHGLAKGKVLMGGVRVPYELVEKLKAEAEKIKNS